MAVRHRDVVLAYIKKLGLRLNLRKSVLSGHEISVWQCQVLLGLMAAVIQLGLLHMWPIQWQLKNKGFHSLIKPMFMVRVTCQALCALSTWRSPRYLTWDPSLWVCSKVLHLIDQWSGLSLSSLTVSKKR